MKWVDVDSQLLSLEKGNIQLHSIWDNHYKVYVGLNKGSNPKTCKEDVLQ